MRLAFAFLILLALNTSAAFAAGDNYGLKPLEITVNKDAILLGDIKVKPADLQAQLHQPALQPGINYDSVLIKAGSSPDSGEVMNVLEAVHQAGFKKIALVTDTTTTKKD